MRPLATIRRRAGPSGWARFRPSRPYISRTCPLAIGGRSASVVTWLDATSAAGRDRTAAARVSGDLVEPGDDLGGVADVVGVVEDALEVELAAALMRGEQIAQRHALVPGA